MLLGLSLSALAWGNSEIKGYHRIGGVAEYRMEHGELIGTTKPNTPNTFLCTDKIYGDFEMEFDVKVDPNLNSGVQVRSNSFPGYMNGVVHGYQIEIDPSARAWSGGLYDESRRGWLQDLTGNMRARAAFRVKDWNHYRVKVVGDHFQTWVNEVPCTDFHDSLTNQGFIAFQVHNVGNNDKPMEVRWKNIHIKDLGIPSGRLPEGGRWLIHTKDDLKNWISEKDGKACPWDFNDGVLTVKPGSGNICTTFPLKDAKIHLEFMVDENGKEGQENGNSGVYVQQRYEIQILNSAPRGPLPNECGSIYTQRAPDYALARPAGEWQSYDIEFHEAKFTGVTRVRPAWVTVYHNGTRIHDHVELKGPTGSGKAESAESLPLRLQDHGNRIRFRNVWIAR